MLLRTRVDRALKTARLTDREKSIVRENRQDFFMTFPPERLWIYFKISRNMDKFNSRNFTERIRRLELRGIEDEFANCESRFVGPIFISKYCTRLRLILI